MRHASVQILFTCPTLVHMFKTAKDPSRFAHFWPRKTTLGHPKWSEYVVFWTFWLGNVLHATTAVQLFISHLASWLCTRRFSQRTFDLPGREKSLEKHTVSRLCYPFPHLHLLSSDSFPSLIFSSHLISSLTLRTSDLLSLSLFLPSLLFICPDGRKFYF